MKTPWLVLIWLCAAAYLAWWLGHNPLPDGYQNEYLHVGNAFDLWGALTAGDVWHLRWYIYTGYWPWGLHAVAAPIFAVTGPSRAALVSTNLVHFAVLLWGTARLGRSFGAPLAPVVLALCPGVFGSLVRYEPNLAAIAWTVAGLACLVGSQGLRQRRMVVGYGLCLGVGLMMDRLTVGFFLLPALLPWLSRLRDPDGRRVAVSLGLATGTTLLLTAAYYREFLLRHADELLGQAPVGEIDAAGSVTAGGGPLYYLLSLPDSQAGTVTGLALLVGLALFCASVWRRRADAASLRPALTLLCATLVPLVFFSLLAKKQVYYTLPLLGPLAVMAARSRWVGAVAVAGGVWAFGALGVGALPGARLVSWRMPEPLVAPRHVLARPPSHDTWPLDAIIRTLPTQPADRAARRAAPPGSVGPSIAVFSEDDRLFEGFVTLAVREGLPGSHPRGVTLDPTGTYEMLDHSQALLWVGPAGGGWPDARDVKMELLADHYDLRELPPVADHVAAAKDQFAEVARMRSGDLELVVFERVAPAPSPRAGPGDGRGDRTPEPSGAL